MIQQLLARRIWRIRLVGRGAVASDWLRFIGAVSRGGWIRICASALEDSARKRKVVFLHRGCEQYGMREHAARVGVQDLCAIDFRRVVAQQHQGVEALLRELCFESNGSSRELPEAGAAELRVLDHNFRVLGEGYHAKSMM